MDGAAAEPLALYVHVPFCRARCPFCHFHTFAQRDPMMAPVAAALAEEIRLWGETLRPSYRLATLYLGGGTPSRLPAELLGGIVAAARGAFPCTADLELTLEASPEDLTPPALAAFAELGVGRLSIGVQRQDDATLRQLGRWHSAATARHAFEAARVAGFRDVNVDLIYGLPGETLEAWHRTLEVTLGWSPEHLSAYSLTVYPGTPLDRSVRGGAVPRPTADAAADMYELAEERLAAAGYHHYEISNWARPGFECRHNLTYWKHAPYLGVGPGAHSCVQGHRFSVVRSLDTYVRRVAAWAAAGAAATCPLDVAALRRVPVAVQVEWPGEATELFEGLMLGLRLVEGIDLAGFRRRYRRDLREVRGAELEGLAREGLVEWTTESVRLTRRGRLLADQVCLRL